MVSLAGVAELVDALDLGSSGESCRGSSPFTRTIELKKYRNAALKTKEKIIKVMKFYLRGFIVSVEF